MAEYIEEDDLEERFLSAANFLPSITSKLKPDRLLKFYGYFKQATVGKCNTPSPYWYNFQSKQKWDAWNCLEDMSKEEAMMEYVNLMDETSPGWESEVVENDKTEGWVSVSTMVGQEEELEDEDKDIYDRVRDGDIEKVKLSLDAGTINELDENGLSALHWAADRGLTDMVTCLLDLGADVNLKDSDGQTALHYACSCGHLQVARLLLASGADPNAICNEGLKPKDVATDEVIELFKSDEFS